MNRLFPEEYNFGGAKCAEESETAARLRKELLHTLEPEERSLLDRLRSARLRASSAEIRGAYQKGFYDGMELMLGYCRWNGFPDSGGNA